MDSCGQGQCHLYTGLTKTLILHAHILRPSELCLGLPGWASTRTNLDFTEAKDSEWQWHQPGHMQICTLPRQITSPAPHHSVFYALPAAQSTASKHWESRKALILIQKLTHYHHSLRRGIPIIFPQLWMRAELPSHIIQPHTHTQPFYSPLGFCQYPSECQQ